MTGKVFAVGIIGFALLLAYVKDRPILYANEKSYQVYEVTIEGSVGERLFSRRGTLFVRAGAAGQGAPAGKNLVDFWLISGKPEGTAGKGAIWLATSSAFYGDRNQALLASVVAQDSVLVADLFPEGSDGNRNAFSLSADKLENATEITAGQVHLQLEPGGRLQGKVDLTGFNTGSQSFLSYDATISGQYIGERSW